MSDQKEMMDAVKGAVIQLCKELTAGKCDGHSSAITRLVYTWITLKSSDEGEVASPGKQPDPGLLRDKAKDLTKLSSSKHKGVDIFMNTEKFKGTDRRNPFRHQGDETPTKGPF